MRSAPRPRTAAQLRAEQEAKVDATQSLDAGRSLTNLPPPNTLTLTLNLSPTQVCWLQTAPHPGIRKIMGLKSRTPQIKGFEKKCFAFCCWVQISAGFSGVRNSSPKYRVDTRS